MEKNDGSRPEKQHTLPSFVLKRFSLDDGDKKFVFQHRSPIAENCWVPVNAEKASIKKNIYTFKTSNGDKSFAMEHLLSKLESQNAELIRQVDSNGVDSLSPQQEYDLSFFMTVQLFRTTKLKSITDAAFLQYQEAETKLKFLAENETELRGKFSGDEIAAYRQTILDGTDDDARFASDFYVKSIMMNISANVPRRIMSMNWRTERVAKHSDTLFIVSDNPFAVRRRGKLTENRVVGLIEEDAEFYFPLSCKTMLIGSNGLVRQPKAANPLRVHELNKISFVNRLDMIWSPTDCEYTRHMLMELNEFRIPTPKPNLVKD